MPDPELVAWFRSGFESRGNALAESEAQLTLATASAVESPTAGQLDLVTQAASDLLQAAKDGQGWLADHPAPNAAVNVAMRQAWKAYETAATILIDMNFGAIPMTAESAEIARAAIAEAHSENWEATMAYVKAVGP